MPVIQYIQSPCDSLGNLKPFISIKTNNGVNSAVKSVGNVIVADCNVDSLKSVIQILETTIKEKNNSVQVKEIATNVLNGFQRFCIKWFWATSVIILIYIIYRVLKIYFKTLI